MSELNQVKFPGKVITVRQFVKEEENIEWLVDGLLPNVGWTLVVGEQGLGKTTLVMQLANAVQEGLPIFGRQVKQGNVLYLQADSVPIEWRAILERIAPDSMAYTMVNIPEGALDNPSYVSVMAGLTVKAQPDLLVFDSLYKFTGDDLNTKRALNTISTMRLIAGTKPFIVIHHPPHGLSRPSGHHSLGATASNVWVLLRDKLKIEKGRLVKLKEILLERDEEGLWQLTDSEPNGNSKYHSDLLKQPLW